MEQNCPEIKKKMEGLVEIKKKMTEINKKMEESLWRK